MSEYQMCTYGGSCYNTSRDEDLQRKTRRSVKLFVMVLQEPQLTARVSLLWFHLIEHMGALFRSFLDEFIVITFKLVDWEDS